MSNQKTPGAIESPRFIRQQDTIDTLALVEDHLESLNCDYHDLGFSDNRGLQTHPYEGAALFSIDTRLKDRASHIAHAPSYGLEHDERLHFYKDTIEGRRFMLSQSALAVSLKDARLHRDQSFHSSRMNSSNQMIWAQPLIHDDTAIGAMELAFTYNQNPDWTFPGNKDLDAIWDKHQKPMNEVASALAALAAKTTSLSKSLEVMPPVTPNSFVIGWDVVGSTRDALSNSYATQEAYLERWKQEREEITRKFGVTVLDRGDGEFIVLPISGVDLNNRASVAVHSKREILPIVDEIIARHTSVAQAYIPDIFKKIKVVVGLGNTEEDQDGQPTSQVIYEIKDLADKTAKPLTFTPSAEEMLFPSR